MVHHGRLRVGRMRTADVLGHRPLRNSGVRMGLVDGDLGR